MLTFHMVDEFSKAFLSSRNLLSDVGGVLLSFEFYGRQTKVKLRFRIGVSEVSNRWHRRRRFHVMADCCVEWLSKVFLFFHENYR
jgi:hypothetical protein